MTLINKITLAALLLTPLLLTPFVATPAFAIQFGNESGAGSKDDGCDTPRFGGPGMASVLLDGDIGHLANDCLSFYNRNTINWR